MKVLLASTVKLDTNGISRFIINTAKVLKNEGIDVEISSPEKANNEIKKNLNDLKIKLVEFNNRKRHPFKYVINLKKYINQNKIDIIHVNGSSTIMVLELLAAKLAGTKVRIAHSHNTTTEHPVINRMLRPLFEATVTDRLACNNAAGEWLFQNKNFKVIPNGIFLKDFQFNELKRKELRRKLGYSSKDIIIGNVGYFNFQKNQEFLINLFSKMPGTKYRLILIGVGTNMEKDKQLVKENHLEKRIKFLGSINDVNNYLNVLDIFVLPSRFEGQPFTLIEAMANGLDTIVSTKVSKETNINGKVKYLSLKKTKKWIQSIKEEKIDLLKRKKQSQIYSQALKKRGYDSESNAETLIEYYQNSLNN